ncbi:unnamed protein product, partial [marine sediment metagenome]
VSNAKTSESIGPAINNNVLAWLAGFIEVALKEEALHSKRQNFFVPFVFNTKSGLTPSWQSIFPETVSLISGSKASKDPIE